MSSETYKNIMLAVGAFTLIQILTAPITTPKDGLEWVKPVAIGLGVTVMIIVTVIRFSKK
jgi:hypothetical protein